MASRGVGARRLPREDCARCCFSPDGRVSARARSAAGGVSACAIGCVAAGGLIGTGSDAAVDFALAAAGWTVAPARQRLSSFGDPCASHAGAAGAAASFADGAPDCWGASDAVAFWAWFGVVACWAVVG